ncbi:MAG: prenyltransferase/squalene oxidase repeat-containing protein, partial [Planctomycetota bacterium]
ESVDFELSSMPAGGDRRPNPINQSTVGGKAVDVVDGGGLTAPSLELEPAAASAVASLAEGLDILSDPLASAGGGLEGRSFANRRALALQGGGSAESEAAVEAGLAWLAEHQWPDGGWRFDLEKCPNCRGYCRDSGSYRTTTAATGLAVLCFLGAGYTQDVGPYQDVVAKGLYYLTERQIITSMGGDLRDSRGDAVELGDAPRGGLSNLLTARRRDTMYSHGIASLAITEAYAMSRDQGLRAPAEEAVKFIVNAQYDDGGWRYDPAFESPGPGDMTVSGWQIATLKSALLAGIEVPYDVWMRIADFLDSLQEENGATYYYFRGEMMSPATTAIGLLGRMICGWPRDRRPLQQGAAKLAAQSPRSNNIYFIYYAAQVLHHVGGPGWQRWNPRMRDYLVSTQSQTGHETGSWYFEEAHSTPGGRLYTTAMAIMTLQVYYRYMPLYQEAFVGETP